MTSTNITPRIERLRRLADLAASHLYADDAEAIHRISRNLIAFERRELTGPEAEGVLSVNVEELLEIIELLTRP